MKIVVNLASFAKAFRQVSNAVPSHTTKDVLKYVKVVASTNAVDLIGSDGAIELIVNVSDVQSSDQFDTFIPAAMMLRILSEIDDETMTLTAVGNGAIEITGNTKRWEFRLSTVEGNDFPRLKVDKTGCVYQFTSDHVLNMIKRTVFAADSESQRYSLDGIRCEFGNDDANFVATDTRRLAIAHGACTSDGKPDSRIVMSPPVIPQKAAKVIQSILEPGQTTSFAFIENQICVKSGLCEVVATVLGGSFPDWRRVVPQSMPVNIALIAGALTSAVRQAKLMRLKEDDDKAIKIEVKKGKLKIMSAAYTGAMDSKAEIQVAYDGEPISIFFDPEYLLAFLKTLDVMSEIKLCLEDSSSMALIECGEYRYALMPLDRSAQVATEKKS